MTFVVSYICATWKELKWDLSIVIGLIYLGVIVRSDFDVGILISGLVAALPIGSLLGVAANLIRWVYIVKCEARRREITFAKFIKTVEYTSFLSEKAAVIIREQRNLGWR